MKKKFKSIEEIFEWVDGECEGANQHDLIGLAQAIFNRIENNVGRDWQFDTALGIAEEVFKSF